MPNMDLGTPLEISSFRQMATVAWDHPGDPTINGFMDFDARPVIARLAELRAQGHHITVTHVVARALALALQRHPHLNVALRRRRLYPRNHVDIFLQVAMPSSDGLGQTDLSGVKIGDCDQKDLPTIARELTERTELVRARTDPELQRSKNTIAKLPRLVLKPIVRLFAWLQREPNWRMKWAGMPRDPFGSAMISSLGMFGIDTAFAPLFPLGGPPIVFLVGAITNRAVCEDDGRIWACPTLRLCGTFDHRLVDGFHLAKLASELKSLLEHETAAL